MFRGITERVKFAFEVENGQGEIWVGRADEVLGDCIGSSGATLCFPLP